MSKFGKELIGSMQQAAAHAQGHKVRSMRVTTVEVPDVKAIREKLHMSQQKFATAYRIVAGYFPDALIADRTALEGAPAKDGSVFLISKKARSDVVLPGFRLRPRSGAAAQSDEARKKGKKVPKKRKGGRKKKSA